MFVPLGQGDLRPGGRLGAARRAGLVCLLFLALGGGRLGLDGIIHGSYRRRARQRAAEKASAGRPAPGHREDTLPIHRDEQPGYREGTQPGYREEPPNPGGYGDTRSGYQEERPQSGHREDTQPGYREDTGRGPQGETRHTVPRQPSGHRSDALSPGTCGISTR